MIMELDISFRYFLIILNTIITVSYSTCLYQGCSSEATCDVEFVEQAIYGCGGTWLTPGVYNGEYLCGDGYKTCDDYIHASSLGLTQDLCLSASLMEPNYFYSSLQPSFGNLHCNSQGNDDLFGCASYESDPDVICTVDGDCSTMQCGPFGALMSTDQLSTAEFGWIFDDSRYTEELDTVYHTITSYEYWLNDTEVSMGGVLCCKDIPLVSLDLGNVSCGEVISNDIVNGDIHSYNLNVDVRTLNSGNIYIRSECDTNTQIKIRVYENNEYIIAESFPSDYWLQCDNSTEALKFHTSDNDIQFSIKIFDSLNSNNSVPYDIHISCDDPPNDVISPDCYIGCNETVTGFYEYGHPQFCEIISFTSLYGSNIFNGCDSTLSVFPDDIRSERIDDEECDGDFQRIQWYNFDDTITHYLMIDGYDSGSYSVSMQCEPPVNLTGELRCPSTQVIGTLNPNEAVIYKVYFNNSLPATFDACASDTPITIDMLDDQLVMNDWWNDIDGRCTVDQYGEYYELYKEHTFSVTSPYYLRIKNTDHTISDAVYTVNYSCDLTRRPSTNHGSIRCGDFISGYVDIGDTHLYISDNITSGQMYIIADCDTRDDISMYISPDDDFDYGSAPKALSNYEWNWQCDKATARVSFWNGWKDTFELEVYRNNDYSRFTSSYYGLNIYCGEAPNDPVEYGGIISCGDENILGTNNVFYNFSNPKEQTVTFSTDSISFQAELILNHLNGDSIMKERDVHLTVDNLAAGDYIFEIHRQREGGLYLLNVLCDEEYIAPNPRTSDNTDQSCNYFARDDAIAAFDVCFGSMGTDEDTGTIYGWSSKYLCSNGEAVVLHYNTPTCDSDPIDSDVYNASEADYYCGATESCPYALITFYGMQYDTDIDDYICSPDTTMWHKFPVVTDLCGVQAGRITSSMVQVSDGNMTLFDYVGYDCGLTGNVKDQYLYGVTVLQSHGCCDDNANHCERMSEAGSYVVIETDTQSYSTTSYVDLTSTESYVDETTTRSHVDVITTVEHIVSVTTDTESIEQEHRTEVPSSSSTIKNIVCYSIVFIALF